jgi:hypothetical protein
MKKLIIDVIILLIKQRFTSPRKTKVYIVFFIFRNKK